MENGLIYCAGSTRASRFAASYLQSLGLPISKEPSREVTHLLLDVPSFGPEGQLRGGGSLDALLKQVSPDAVIYGGKLEHPSLAGRRTVDFLTDQVYTAENAYITAECALDVALPYLNRTLRGCPTLIIGWGRIGKCLGQLLKAIGADITIAARKPADRAILHAMGYHTEDPGQLCASPSHFRLIFNTVPAPVLNREQISRCRDDCIRIELASVDGMEDEDAIIARGLPGLHMPQSSGTLIAHTFLRYYREEETL